MRRVGVHSEVGKLRTVLVCGPSLAHQRLTPANCHQLLFDDVIWVHEAQKDHYDFTLKMQERGVEIDVAGGIRPQFGLLPLDVGYVHYFYTPEHVSLDYGEIFAKADYNFNDLVTFGGRVYFAPDFNQSGNTASGVAGGVRVPLPHDFSVYAQFVEDFEQLAWTAGISYSWKAVTLHVRYWGTNLSHDECVVRSGFSDGCDSHVVATLSIDTSWSGVRDWMSGK